MTETCMCCLCELKFEKEKVKHIEVKGMIKDICKECVDSIKGLI